MRVSLRFVLFREPQICVSLHLRAFVCVELRLQTPLLLRGLWRHPDRRLHAREIICCEFLFATLAWQQKMFESLAQQYLRVTMIWADNVNEPSLGLHTYENILSLCVLSHPETLLLLSEPPSYFLHVLIVHVQPLYLHKGSSCFIAR